LNERLNYLITTAGPLNEEAGLPGRLIFPYVTDSTGYATRLILISRPGEQGGTGVVHYLAADGTPLQIDTVRLGSVRIEPFLGYATPHAQILLSHSDGGVLTSIVGVEGQIPNQSFRFYAESTGDYDAGIAGSTRSGVTLANPTEVPVTVVLEMRSLSGSLLRRSQPLVVPPLGQTVLFLNQVPGLETLAAPFGGVLSVVPAPTQAITATAFRTVYNERGNVLLTTTGPLQENAGSPQLVFPHIAEGGGYTTQFIVIGGSSGQANTGVLRFFNQEGNPLNVTLAPR
jgi:hypothetical protein